MSDLTYNKPKNKGVMDFMRHKGRRWNWQMSDNLALAAAPGFGQVLLLLAGALGYGLLEISWRGWTHWSMLLAGGLCFCCINYLDVQLPGCGNGHKAWLCCLVITALELCFGLVFNCWLGLDIWDYTRLPGNFLGQVCLPYAALWYLLSLLLLRLARWLRPAL